MYTRTSLIDMDTKVQIEQGLLQNRQVGKKLTSLSEEIGENGTYNL